MPTLHNQNDSIYIRADSIREKHFIVFNLRPSNKIYITEISMICCHCHDNNKIKWGNTIINRERERENQHKHEYDSTRRFHISENRTELQPKIRSSSCKSRDLNGLRYAIFFGEYCDSSVFDRNKCLLRHGITTFWHKETSDNFVLIDSLNTCQNVRFSQFTYTECEIWATANLY